MILYCTVALFVLMSFNGYVKGEDPKLSEFGEAVEKNITSDTYDKTFNVSTTDDDEKKEALEAGTKNFYEKMGFTYNKTAADNVEKENEKVGLNHINAKSLFYSQTYALNYILKEKGILNDTNVDYLASKFVEYLDEEAKSNTDGSAKSTCIAQTSALAKFLKFVGITSEEDVKKSEKAFLEELDKFKKADDGKAGDDKGDDKGGDKGDDNGGDNGDDNGGDKGGDDN